MSLINPNPIIYQVAEHSKKQDKIYDVYAQDFDENAFEEIDNEEVFDVNTRFSKP
jgi:hypothetical protein